jgi:hypothetical protein
MYEENRMTYDTQYDGTLLIEPPLHAGEVRALTAFFTSRRIQTTGGPLDCRTLDMGHPDVLEYNLPPEGQPSLHCNLEISEDGTVLAWSGNPDTGPALHRWIAYVIDHLLKPDAEFDFRERNVSIEMTDDNLLWDFSFDHYVNGEITGRGMVGDTWKIVVEDNEVSEVKAVFTIPLAATAEIGDEEDEDE